MTKLNSIKSSLSSKIISNEPFHDLSMMNSCYCIVFVVPFHHNSIHVRTYTWGYYITSLSHSLNKIFSGRNFISRRRTTQLQLKDMVFTIRGKLHTTRKKWVEKFPNLLLLTHMRIQRRHDTRLPRPQHATWKALCRDVRNFSASTQGLTQGRNVRHFRLHCVAMAKAVRRDATLSFCRNARNFS